MMDLEHQIITELTSDDPLTFFDLMDRMDFTAMPVRKGNVGQKLGHHGPVMEALAELVRRGVIAELTSGIEMPRYRLSAPMCERLAS